jgi:alpha-beta hydrolase superfamily lysophospholipase
MPPTTAKRKSPRRGEGDPITQFAAIIWRPTDTKPTKLWFDHPIEALTAAVEYLKAGYQCRLSDGCVQYFADLPRPDPLFVQAAHSNGQLAAMTGPPQIGEGK